MIPTGKTFVVKLTPILGQADVCVKSILVTLEATSAETAIHAVRRIQQFQDPRQWDVEYSRAGFIK
jgi:hypothetical protein